MGRVTEATVSPSPFRRGDLPLPPVALSPPRGLRACRCPPGPSACASHTRVLLRGARSRVIRAVAARWVDSFIVAKRLASSLQA